MRRRPGLVPLLFALTAGSTLSAQATTDWREARVLGERSYTGVMAYDSARDRTVLCNGTTWEWDGLAWAQMSVGPPGFYPTAMVFHGGRQRCIAVAQRTVLPGPHPNELWEWDGSAWSQLSSPTAPGVQQAMTYDWARARLILFGKGASGTAETWEWDGTNSSRVMTANSPTPRWTSIAYDLVRQRTVMFGGMWRPSLSAPDIYYDDTWEYDGVDWTLVTQGHPLARWGHGLVFDLGRQRVVMHGGGDQSLVPFSDTWSWDGTTWTRVSTSNLPAPTASSALAYDSARQRVVRHGGRDAYGWVIDTWELDPVEWEQMTEPSAPAGSSRSALAYNSTRSRIVTFGGVPLTNEVWEWDGLHWQLMRVASPTRPAPRFGSAMAYDAARQRMVLFGGSDGVAFLNDTWTWDGHSWLQIANTASTPWSVNSMVMIYDEHRHRCVLYNGRTHEWDGAVWTQTSTQNVGTFVAMAYDVSRQRTVLISGQNPVSTWTYDGATWTQRNPVTSPPGMLSMGMTYDRVGRRVVLTGTLLNGTTFQAWNWDGTDWTPAITATVPPTNASSPAYDAANGEVVLRSGFMTMLLGPTVPAAATDFGSGCGPSGNAPLLAGGIPYRGNGAFTMELRQAQAASACLFAVSFASQSLPLGSGCTLLLQSPVAAVTAITNASGVAMHPFAIPDQQSLRGLSLHWQGAVLDPAGPLGGVSLTQRRSTLIGD